MIWPEAQSYRRQNYSDLVINPAEEKQRVIKAEGSNMTDMTELCSDTHQPSSR